MKACAHSRAESRQGLDGMCPTSALSARGPCGRGSASSRRPRRRGRSPRRTRRPRRPAACRAACRRRRCVAEAVAQLLDGGLELLPLDLDLPPDDLRRASVAASCGHCPSPSCLPLLSRARASSPRIPAIATRPSVTTQEREPGVEHDRERDRDRREQEAEAVERQQRGADSEADRLPPCSSPRGAASSSLSFASVLGVLGDLLRGRRRRRDLLSGAGGHGFSSRSPSRAACRRRRQLRRRRAGSGRASSAARAAGPTGRAASSTSTWVPGCLPGGPANLEGYAPGCIPTPDRCRSRNANA